MSTSGPSARGASTKLYGRDEISDGLAHLAERIIQRGTKKDRENAFRNSFVSSRNPDEAELTLRASDCVGAQQE